MEDILTNTPTQKLLNFNVFKLSCILITWLVYGNIAKRDLTKIGTWTESNMCKNWTETELKPS